MLLFFIDLPIDRYHKTIYCFNIMLSVTLKLKLHLSRIIYFLLLYKNSLNFFLRPPPIAKACKTCLITNFCKPPSRYLHIKS